MTNIKCLTKQSSRKSRENTDSAIYLKRNESAVYSIRSTNRIRRKRKAIKNADNLALNRVLGNPVQITQQQFINNSTGILIAINQFF